MLKNAWIYLTLRHGMFTYIFVSIFLKHLSILFTRSDSQKILNFKPISQRLKKLKLSIVKNAKECLKYLTFKTCEPSSEYTRTTDTQWRHKSKKSEKLGRCGRQNMLRPYLTIWDWDWIFGRPVKDISSLGVRSPCV